MKEFEAQKVEKNQAKWSKVSGEAQDKLMEMDSVMAAWRKRRMNVMFVDLFDTLSGSVLTLKDYAMQAFTDQLAFVGKPPTESQVPQHIEQLKAAMEKVDKATAAAKAPEEPKK